MPGKNVLYASTAALCGMIAATPAAAEYEVQVGGRVRYEDNIFRRNRTDINNNLFPASDVIYGPFANAYVLGTPGGFDTQATLSTRYDRYKNNGALNNFSYDGAVSARRDNGVFGVQLDGVAQRRLSSFGDIRARIRNVQSFNSINATLSYAVANDFRIVATPGYSQSDNSADLLKDFSFRQYGGGVGLGYYSPLGNSIAVTVSRRETEGTNDRTVPFAGGLVESRLRQTDTSVDVLGFYQISTFTTVQGSLSYVDRNDRSVLDADYKGPYGSVQLIYAPRPSLRARLNVGRQLAAQSYLFVSAVRTDFIRGDVSAAVFDDTIVQLTAGFSHRRLSFDPTATNDRATRIDNTTNLTAGASQRIGNHVLATVSAGHEFRSSNLANRRYNATFVSASLAFVFGTRGRPVTLPNQLRTQ